MLPSILMNAYLIVFISFFMKCKAWFRQTFQKIKPFVHLHSIGTLSHVPLSQTMGSSMRGTVSVHLYTPVSILWTNKKNVYAAKWMSRVCTVHVHTPIHAVREGPGVKCSLGAGLCRMQRACAFALAVLVKSSILLKEK